MPKRLQVSGKAVGRQNLMLTKRLVGGKDGEQRGNNGGRMGE